MEVFYFAHFAVKTYQIAFDLGRLDASRYDIPAALLFVVHGMFAVFDVVCLRETFG